MRSFVTSASSVMIVRPSPHKRCKRLSYLAFVAKFNGNRFSFSVYANKGNLSFGHLSHRTVTSINLHIDLNGNRRASHFLNFGIKTDNFAESDWLLKDNLLKGYRDKTLSRYFAAGNGPG